jgi:hypothetical protein
MGTDIPQRVRERNLFPDYRCGFGILPFTNETNIARYIYACRTSMFAGNERLFPLVPRLQYPILIPESTRGTNLNAGTAESATDISQRTVEGSADVGVPAPLYKREHPHATQLITSSDTSAAEDALAQVMDEKGIAGINRGVFWANSQMLLSEPQILSHRLQLTIEVLRAHQAIGRMSSEHQFHSHATYAVNLRRFGLDYHPLCRRSST